MFEIMIDTGGTFTDGVLIDEKQGLTVAKAQTLPSDPARGILNCIERLAEERSMTQQELLRNTKAVTIGTTLPTNTIIQEKGAKCCLIHTKGFRDVFELGRTIPKTDIYNLKVASPKILIPRHLRYGVEERTQYDGSVVTHLNEVDVRTAVALAKKQGVEVPVVCFLHSYVNPSHEERAAEIIREEYPNVVVSSRILRRWIEYDRASTATYAAYVKPLLTRFVDTLKSQLAEAHFAGTLLFSTGLGDVATADMVVENPGTVVGSGVATGALFGKFLAELCSFDNVVTFDMGGTSLDIAVLQNRTISTTSEMVIDGQKNAMESMDVTSIGAGGGSIGWIDLQGVLRVGPHSAGADPGPACYGKGGTEPTVTDANVVLGYIPTDYFLGGKIILDRALAEKSMEKVAAQSGIDTVQAAYTITSLEEAIMGEKVFLSIVEKGYDPRDFVLLVGGGAGAVHGAAVAKRIGIKQVYIPKHAAVFSALGGFVADYGYNLSRFLGKRDDEADAGSIQPLYAAMEAEAVDTLARQGVERKGLTVVRGAEMRYYGQLRDINITLPESVLDGPFEEANMKELIATFHARHRGLYGHSNPNLPVMIALLKLRVFSRRRPLEWPEMPEGETDSSAAIKRKRQVYWKEQGGFYETPCYDGDKLRNGSVIVGPAVIEEQKTTVVIPPGCVARVDAYDNYVISTQSA
jgi:N-methylhydantoinase A